MKVFMKIIVSQQDKKLKVTFNLPPLNLPLDKGEKEGVVDSYSISKAEDFLLCVDKFLKKRYISKLEDFAKNADLEFRGAGLLTERVVRAIMLGLCFS